MEKINFDSGVKTFKVNGRGILRFNPSDPNLFKRFMEAVQKIKEIEHQQSQEAQKINMKDDGAVEKSLQIMHEIDKRIKAILNDVFGNENDFDAILEGVNLMAVATNGERVISNLMDALLPIVEAGVDAYAADEIKAAKKNREQRRASV